MSQVIPTSCRRCGNLVACTCDLAKSHKAGCDYLRAATLGLELACEHGFQACPKCDPCTCGVDGLRGVR